MGWRGVCELPSGVPPAMVSLLGSCTILALGIGESIGQLLSVITRVCVSVSECKCTYKNVCD